MQTFVATRWHTKQAALPVFDLFWKSAIRMNWKKLRAKRAEDKFDRFLESERVFFLELRVERVKEKFEMLLEKWATRKYYSEELRVKRAKKNLKCGCMVCLMCVDVYLMCIWCVFDVCLMCVWCVIDCVWCGFVGLISQDLRHYTMLIWVCPRSHSRQGFRGHPGKSKSASDGRLCYQPSLFCHRLFEGKQREFGNKKS